MALINDKLVQILCHNAVQMIDKGNGISRNELK